MNESLERKSADLANTDALSRLPDAYTTPVNEVHDIPINLVSFANKLHVVAIISVTQRGRILCFQSATNTH